MTKKKLYHILSALICCYLSSGIALSNEELRSTELTESSQSISSQVTTQLPELPTIDVPSEHQQIALYKQIYSQYNNSEFDYQRTHMEGLDKIVEIMYSYFSQSLENPVHCEWLNDFWIETIKVISAKQLTFEYFVKDFSKLVLLKFKDQHLPTTYDPQTELLNASTKDAFLHIYNQESTLLYNFYFLNKYSAGILKKFPFIMPIFKEDGILSLDSLIEAELSQDLLYGLIGVPTKADLNDCTQISKNILYFVNHDLTHFIQGIRNIINSKLSENYMLSDSLSPQLFIFHHLVKFIYETQPNLTSADLVSIFILLHESFLFQGDTRGDEYTQNLEYIKNIQSTAPFDTFWANYTSYNRASYLNELIGIFLSYTYNKNLPFALITNNDESQGFDENGYYFYIKNTNEDEFSERNLDVVFKILPKVRTRNTISSNTNRNCTTMETEVEITKNEGSNKLTAEELEFFKKQYEIKYPEADLPTDTITYCEYCRSLCRSEEINLLNYAYEGMEAFSESMDDLAIDIAKRKIKYEFFKKYADLFEDPVVQQKIQGDLLKSINSMTEQSY